MKLSTAILFCSLFLGVSSQSWLSFLSEAFQGSRDMWRAYSDMKEANNPDAERYFISRGNYDAARRGPGGAWAAKLISDARERSRRFTNYYANDYQRDSVRDANEFAAWWGRSGKDPESFRPKSLPEKYPREI